jgi:hypothetical protein
VAPYEELVEQKLKVSEAFLNDSAPIIRDRLKRAAEEFDRDHASIFAINMCLHAASSIILSNPDHLRRTLEEVRLIAGLEGRDPTTVLTVSTLFYLVQRDAARAARDKTDPDYQGELKKLRSGFDAINWMIGPDAMRILGIEMQRMEPRASSPPPSSQPTSNQRQSGAASD